MTIDTPPRRTNPHQLTIKQHTLPLRSIERFCHENQAVKVKLNTKDIFIDLKPNNSLFCANRAWDHRTETVVSKDIESNFQNLADKINSRLIRAMCTEDQLTVTHMYLLWKYRCKLASNPIADVKINLVTPERELSIDSKEVLEKRG
ncbi:hypothetical protein [Chromobacterium subtsugae]|uniref:hypothetical protein n=1 Tax=Chromobacterium subtsugae TaxID=251747 RepID=UPI0012FFC54D|nr:hypothetical protein [Chromobacterium subtsugae]